MCTVYHLYCIVTLGNTTVEMPEDASDQKNWRVVIQIHLKGNFKEMGAITAESQDTNQIQLHFTNNYIWMTLYTGKHYTWWYIG